MAIVWSASKFDMAHECLRRYDYAYNKGVTERTTPAMALGIFLHHKQERFFKEDLDFRPRERIERFYAPTNHPKNKSPEAFANACGGQWKRLVRRDLEKDHKIGWSYDQEPYVYLAALRELSLKMYDRNVTEGPPLLAELWFETIPLKHKDHAHYFRGGIDDVRKKDGALLVRDYKTGWDVLPQYELYYDDSQFTLYGLALIYTLATNPRIALRCGLNPDETKKWVGKEADMIPSLLMERSEVRRGVDRRTTRTRMHAEELFETLDGLEMQIERNLFPASREERRCRRCGAYANCIRDFRGNKSSYMQNLLFYEHEARTERPETLKARQRSLRFS